MIVPFPPGGVADITARPVAEAMGRFLKQTVVVENKAGAGGGVGMQYVARAKPDGYTVLLALSSISIIPEADKVLGRDPMYQLNQLVPIARFTADPDGARGARRRPVEEREGPDRRGEEGARHDSLRLVGQLRDDARADGDVQRLGRARRCCTCRSPARAPPSWRCSAGRCRRSRPGPRRSWATSRAARCACSRRWGESRHPALPDVPTLKELGYDAQFSQWTGLFVPAGTPEPVIAKLREAARAAVEDATFKAALAKVETPVQYLDQPQFRASGTPTRASSPTW